MICPGMCAPLVSEPGCRPLGRCISKCITLFEITLTLFRISLRLMGGFFGPAGPSFWGCAFHLGISACGYSWCDQGHFGCTDCLSLSQKMLNIVKDVSRQRRGKLPFPTYSTNFAVHVLYPIIIGCWWFWIAHFTWANGHGGIKEKGHYWNNINGMET